MNLLINYYRDKNEARRRELDLCLDINLKDKNFSKMIVASLVELPISENESYTKNSTIDGLIICIPKERPTFKELFEIANKYADPKGITVIANSDITFDDSIKLAERHLKPNQCYALSRWDVDPNGDATLHNHSDSQDTWIFRGLIKNVPDCDFTLGTPGCDNAIAERLERAGYDVKNPSVSIKTYHYHISNIRNYQCPKPYKFVTPHMI